MATTQSSEEDKQTVATIVRQYAKLEQLKHKLTKQGLLEGNATPPTALDNHHHHTNQR